MSCASAGTVLGDDLAAKAGAVGVIHLLFACLQAPGRHIRSVRYVAHTLDALLYAFSPVIAAYLLRLLQRRTLLARLGRRTLIIAEAAHVHQVMPSGLLSGGRHSGC